MIRKICFGDGKRDCGYIRPYIHVHIKCRHLIKTIGILNDDVIKWKHFPRYWPYVRWIHRSPVNSPHKGQWRGALMFSLIYASIPGWVNNRETGDLRRHRAHCDVIVMSWQLRLPSNGLVYVQNVVSTVPADALIIEIMVRYVSFIIHLANNDFEDFFPAWHKSWATTSKVLWHYEVVENHDSGSHLVVLWCR